MGKNCATTITTLLLPSYRAWMTAADLAPATRELRVSQLRRINDAIPLATATTEQLTTWLASRQWKTETMRSHRNCLRVFYAWAVAHGHLEHNPAAALPRIRPCAGLPRPASEETIEDAVHAATPRVRLMLELGAYAGLRRAEIAQVHTRDVHRDLIGWSLQVHGKGRRERMVPLTNHLATTLRARPEGWVFPSPATAGGHLTPAYVGRLMSAALGRGVVPHQLRHRFASAAYASSGDIYAVQELLGHAKAETTQVYTELPAGRLRAIIDSIAA